MSWIWLNKEKYPDNQNSSFSHFSENKFQVTCVSIKKEFDFDKRIKEFVFSFSIDTVGFLYCNGELMCGTTARGPGDFLTRERSVPCYFYQEGRFVPKDDTKSLQISAQIRAGCLELWDFSSGHGGFFLKGEVIFDDGSVSPIETDESWQIKLEPYFMQKEFSYDNTVIDNEYENASKFDFPLKLVKADIKIPKEDEISFDNCFRVDGQSRKSFHINLPLIYSSYYEIEVDCDGLLLGKIASKEDAGFISKEHKFKVNKSCRFRLFEMVSCGGFVLYLNNKSDKPASVTIHIKHSHYPYDHSYSIKTNNARFADLFKKCQFVVNNCSQTMILDSPKHLEPLASCAGDYNIISLVNALSSGDLSLSKHTLRGYAYFLEDFSGHNINKNYALIFIKWLKNIYMFDGDKSLLKDCIGGARATIDMYLSCLGENGLVEKIYNYIFVDWLMVDGINLFSPTKNLGQSVSCMYLYDALKCVEFMYAELGDNKNSRKMHREANKLKNAINNLLFDKDKGLYCEGLNTLDEPTIPISNEMRKILDAHWHYAPKNTDKIYFRKHANVLAVDFGLANKKTSRKILREIFYGEIKECEIQPYFLHYLFEAIHKADMDKKYAMKLLKEFLKHVRIKDKGLPEGFYAPTPMYKFDYSHAWACTPYYSFIMASSGLKILEPGMKKISLKPQYLGIDAEYTIPTPYGEMTISIKKGEKPVVIVPKGIEVVK